MLWANVRSKKSDPFATSSVRWKRAEQVSYQSTIDQGALLPPVTHPDSAHCLVSGTGLTHLGSAGTRDAMHVKLKDQGQAMTDSMKMFKLGLEGGKPESGKIGAQPEWFYKGDGDSIVAPYAPNSGSRICARWRRRARVGRTLFDR